MKETFLMKGEWEQSFALLSMEQRGRLLTDIFAYQNRGELPQGDPVVGMAFTFMQRFFDYNAAKYEDTVKARSDSGKKGGRPKAPEEEKQKLSAASKKSKCFSEKAKKAVSVSDSVSVPDSVSVSVSPRGDDIAPEREKADKPKVQWAENVTMTNDEHESLLATHGPADTNRLIEILDNYKGSTGKKYKSDYRAILSWCIDRLTEEKSKEPRHKPGGNPFLEMLEEADK